MNIEEFYGFLFSVLISTAILVLAGYLNYKDYENRYAILFLIGMCFMYGSLDQLIRFDFKLLNDFVAYFVILIPGAISVVIAYLSGKYFKWRHERRENARLYAERMKHARQEWSIISKKP